MRQISSRKARSIFGRPALLLDFQRQGYSCVAKHRFIPARSSQFRYPELKHWLPFTGNSTTHFVVYSCVSSKFRRSNMTMFLSTLHEEDLLTFEVSDEALETAGGNDIAGNYTLAACTGLSVCPG
jgi:hypothetical protein